VKQSPAQYSRYRNGAGSHADLHRCTGKIR
jgi:hypothetical protein